jgi:hypothetical protein
MAYDAFWRSMFSLTFSYIMNEYITDFHISGFPMHSFYLISSLEHRGMLALGMLYSLWSSSWSLRGIQFVSSSIRSSNSVWADTSVFIAGRMRFAQTLSSMNMMNNVITAWLPLIVWKQVDAPRYHKGFITASCTSVLFVIIIVLISVLQKREVQR